MFRSASLVLLGALALFPVCHAQPTATPAAASPAKSAAGPADIAMLTGEQVIRILDETVDWYRTLGVQEQNASQPSDLLIVYANRQTADQVVGLAFDLARANAELLSSEAEEASSADPSSPQALAHQQAALEAERQQAQAEIAAYKQKPAEASKLTELQSELAMINARKNLLDTMADFVAQNNPKGAGASALKAHIDAIAATLPTAAPPGGAATPAAAGVKGGAALAGASGAERDGILELGSRALKLHDKINTIEAIDARTAALAETFRTISARPLEQLKGYGTQSETLSGEADHADSATLKGLRDRFDTTAWLFKETAGIYLPLSKEAILLQQYRHNLTAWRDSSKRQYEEALKTLALRIAVLLAVLLAVFAVAEAWRRAVLRYIQEPRRRGQMLMVRRIVCWVAVIVIVAFNLVTEVSTFATFAGLLTAGVAVAMQSVLLSVVGYFFLIGKYGIRIGDRIQIGTVVGEVVDLGLVRMHLMELSPQGPLGPTGRVVGFANLVVFQAAGGLFRQIPGVSLEWREFNVDLPSSDDYARLRQRLIEAVNAALSEYHADISEETSRIARSSAAGTAVNASPHVRMQVNGGKVQAIVRFPVYAAHADDMGDRVAGAVFDVLNGGKALPAPP